MTTTEKKMWNVKIFFRDGKEVFYPGCFVSNYDRHGRCDVLRIELLSGHVLSFYENAIEGWEKWPHST